MGRYIRKYNQFINESNNYSIINRMGLEYQEILNEVNLFYNDIERSKEEVDYYLSTVNDLYDNGGKVYRVIFHYDEKYINKESLGEHWCIDELAIGNFSNMLGDGAYEQISFNDIEGKFSSYNKEDLRSYIITADIPPNFIDLRCSINQFIGLPNELEICLVDEPTSFTIDEIKNKYY